MAVDDNPQIDQRYLITDNDGDFIYIRPRDDGFFEIVSVSDNDIDPNQSILICLDLIPAMVKMLTNLLLRESKG